MSLLQSFIQRVERFLKRHDMPPSRFGKEAVNDPSFVFDLRAGRKPNPDLIDSVDRWMRAYGAEHSPAKRRVRPSECVAA